MPIKNNLLKIELISNQQENIITINKKLIKRFKIKENTFIQLNISKLKKKFLVKIGENNSNNTLYLNSKIGKTLCLYKDCPYRYKIGKNEIFIGPFIGIMLKKYRQKNKLLGQQNGFIKCFLNYGNEINVKCFIFRMKSIDWKNGLINGKFFRKGRLVNRKFPIPDVVYFRDSGNLSKMNSKIIKDIQLMGVKFFNPRALDKWSMHKILIKNKNIFSYMPETKLINSFHEVRAMIKKYGSIYIKPVFGAKGKHIIKISKIDNKDYYKCKINNEKISSKEYNLEELKKYIDLIIKDKKYIVQREINLLRFNGGLTDIRILIQKDYSDKWKITGEICRVGKKRSITSNLASGGNIYSLNDVLKKQFSNKEKRLSITQNINSLSLKIANYLEKENKLLGELGLDMGIDLNGDIWFIEANFRPGRKLSVITEDDKVHRLSIERPLFYSIFLSKF